MTADPYEFKFEMTNMDGICVSANHDSGVYKTPFTKQFKECPRIGPNPGSEVNLNETKDIIIYKSGDGYLKWFFKSDSKQCFDSGVVKVGNTIFARRTIHSYWYVPQYKEKTIAENRKSVYVTFFDVAKEPCEAFKEGQLVPDRGYAILKFPKSK